MADRRKKPFMKSVSVIFLVYTETSIIACSIRGMLQYPSGPSALRPPI
jgi:hypothetical protein